LLTNLGFSSPAYEPISTRQT